MNILAATVTALSRTSCHPARRTISRRRPIRALAMLLAACATPALALPPNISTRSYVQVPYRNTSYNFTTGSSSSSVNFTAVAAGTEFALLGLGEPRLDSVWEIFPYTESASYTANPVIVTDPPWADGTSFATHKKIDPPVNPLGTEKFGASLAIHANRVAVGSPEVIIPLFHPCCEDSDPEDMELLVTFATMGGGRVHLYQYNGTSFAPERTIVYGGLYEHFGAALALDANHLLVGRPGSYPAAADLFDPGTGNLITTFTSPSTIDGFGETVALAGDLALVGAPDQAIVYVYRHDGAGTWSAAGELTSPGSGSDFGAAIAADGERILVGAPDIDQAYIFEDNGDDDWPVVAELSGGTGSRFGTSVALTGDSAFIGAPRFSYGPLTHIGIVRRHDRASDGTWPYSEHKNDRESKNYLYFGNMIAASPTMLAVARPWVEMSVFTGPPPGC